MNVWTSQTDVQSSTFQSNREAMFTILEDWKHKCQEAQYQGPESYLKKHEEKGKLLPRTRVERLLDEESPFLELMPLAGWRQKGMTVGGSIIVGIGLVNGVECLVHANVSTLKGGALNQVSVQKSTRANQIALENRLPTIYLVESAGADLPQQSLVFNYGGEVFREITRRSKLGIPSVSVVFGNSTAGGAYIPGMSDYVVMVQKQARTYLAGPPLVKMATGENADDETLGGADMHARQSGLCDYVANDEISAIKVARDIVSQFHWDPNIVGQVEFRDYDEPKFDREEILGVVSADVRKPYDARELIARLVDGSKFFEFKPKYGETLVTVWAEIFGFPVGILANNGVLFSEAANKGTQFIQLCEKRNVPLIYLQNITGFMVGTESEQNGIIKNGAKLINAVSNCGLPAITFVVGSSYGAGNYGMCGRAYQPRFLFTWPNARLAVMGPDQLVGVLKILQMQKMKKVSEGFDREKAEAEFEFLKAKIDEESQAYFGTSRVWDDGVIDPRDTRFVAGMCLGVIERHRETNRDGSYGVFRM